MHWSSHRECKVKLMPLLQWHELGWFPEVEQKLDVGQRRRCFFYRSSLVEKFLNRVEAAAQ